MKTFITGVLLILTACSSKQKSSEKYFDVESFQPSKQIQLGFPALRVWHKGSVGLNPFEFCPLIQDSHPLAELTNLCVDQAIKIKILFRRFLFGGTCRQNEEHSCEKGFH